MANDVANPPVHGAAPVIGLLTTERERQIAQAFWVRGYKAAYEDEGKDAPSDADAARAARGRV